VKKYFSGGLEARQDLIFGANGRMFVWKKSMKLNRRSLFLGMLLTASIVGFVGRPSKNGLAKSVLIWYD
jgi:hypothetical protein